MLLGAPVPTEAPSGGGSTKPERQHNHRRMRSAVTGRYGRRTMDVELLYFEGCPSWRVMDERLGVLGAEFDFEHQRILVDTPEAAERAGFLGSPTVRIDGEDPFAAPGAAVGLSCRVYPTVDGLIGCPTLAELRAAFQRHAPARRPRARPPQRAAPAPGPADLSGASPS